MIPTLEKAGASRTRFKASLNYMRQRRRGRGRGKEGGGGGEGKREREREKRRRGRRGERRRGREIGLHPSKLNRYRPPDHQVRGLVHDCCLL